MNAIIFLVGLSLIFSAVVTFPLDIEKSSEENEDALNEDITTTDFPSNDNVTVQNLYVIKAVVYEIGILTNVDENDTSITNETQTNEQIDLTFFNPDRNGSIIDLGDIPLPIQTNISGHVLTGIAPVDIGSISAANFNSINISESLLPGAPIGDALQQLVPSVPIINSTTSLINNVALNNLTGLPSNIDINDLTVENTTLNSLSHLGSLFQPLPLTLSNQRIFASKDT